LYASLTFLLLDAFVDRRTHAWALAACASVLPWVMLGAFDGGPGAIVHPELRGRTFDVLSGNTLPLVVVALALYVRIRRC
jgi:hypothetical protein